jgi:hypothetical protein
VDSGTSGFTAHSPKNVVVAAATNHILTDTLSFTPFGIIASVTQCSGRNETELPANVASVDRTGHQIFRFGELLPCLQHRHSNVSCRRGGVLHHFRHRLLHQWRTGSCANVHLRQYSSWHQSDDVCRVALDIHQPQECHYRHRWSWYQRRYSRNQH